MKAITQLLAPALAACLGFGAATAAQGLPSRAGCVRGRHRTESSSLKQSHTWRDTVWDRRGVARRGIVIIYRQPNASGAA